MTHYSDVIKDILENLGICKNVLLSPVSTHIPCFDLKIYVLQDNLTIGKKYTTSKFHQMRSV